MATRSRRSWWLALAAGLSTSPVSAGVQQVTPVPTAQIASSSEAVSVTAEYLSVGPCNAHLVGLGLRAHWDASLLTLEGVTNVLTTALVAQGRAEADLDDLDGDPATDSFVHLAWADVDARWTGVACAQATSLVQLDFTTRPEFAGSTTVNFTASSTAVGRSFSAIAATISDHTVTDTDGDGIPDTSDPDDDNDGIVDIEDAYPFDPALPGRSDVIVLEPGLNVIAYLSAVSVEYGTCRGLFAGLGGVAVIERLTRLDPVTQTLESCDGAGGTDYPIVSGEGYLVEAYAAATAELSGVSVCPDLILSAGLNLRGYPKPPPGLTCFQWLEELPHDAVSAIRRLDRSTGRFEGCMLHEDDGVAMLAGKDFPIVPGEGYLLSSPTGGVSIPLRCGP